MPSSSAPTIYFPGILLLTTDEMNTEASAVLTSARYVFSLDTATPFRAMTKLMSVAVRACVHNTYDSALENASKAQIFEYALYRNMFMAVGTLDVGSVAVFVPADTRIEDRLHLKCEINAAMAILHRSISFGKVSSQQ